MLSALDRNILHKPMSSAHFLSNYVITLTDGKMGCTRWTDRIMGQNSSNHS